MQHKYKKKQKISYIHAFNRLCVVGDINWNNSPIEEILEKKNTFKIDICYGHLREQQSRLNKNDWTANKTKRNLHYKKSGMKNMRLFDKTTKKFIFKLTQLCSLSFIFPSPSITLYINTRFNAYFHSNFHH